jgi:RNA polymerase-binding transcription factor DksA
MPRSSRSAAPQKATKKKAAAKAAPARAGKATSGTTRAATRGPTKAKAATKAKAKAKAPTKATPAKTARTARTAKKATTKAPTKAPAKSTRKRSAVADKFLEAQRKALLEERDTYTRHATDLRAEAEQLAADREPGDVQFDEESGQGDTMNVERERDLALSAQALAAVEDIDRALAKIDAGTYGICERCGQPIPKERLKALPYAALCVACKSGGLTTRR